eukprot:1075549-Amorphochlora_amoeboformis.AAC.1
MEVSVNSSDSKRESKHKCKWKGQGQGQGQGQSQGSPASGSFKVLFPNAFASTSSRHITIGRCWLSSSQP